MKTFRIKATLVSAVDADFFTDTRGVKESVSVFMKSQKTGYSGPHYLENLWLDEVIRFMEAGLYYIIKWNNARQYSHEFDFKLLLRQAEMDDFQWSPHYQRWYRIYYLLWEGNTVEGPLYYLPATDAGLFKTRLQAGQVYVPNERQDFKPL